MFNKIFLQVLNMSFTASYVILFVILARILLQKAPKIFSYSLWSVVLFRLVCPFSFESIFSIFNITGRDTDDIRPFPTEITSVPMVETAIQRPNSTVGIIPLERPPFELIFTAIWLLGIVSLLIYSFVSLYKLTKKLKTAAPLNENIYLSDNISTAFVLGVFRPKIYLPALLNQKEQEYILLHEQTHIKRFDHMVKILAFLVLCVHWFNPFVWVAFFALAKDMELSCDEAVIRTLGNEVKKDYSSSLLSLAIGRKTIGGTPLFFGKSDTKSRVKNVLSYKKPAFWVILVTALACVVAVFCLMSNPKKSQTFPMKGNKLSDLQPLEITQNIGEIAGVDFSELKLTPDNFGFMVSSDFDYVQHEIVRFLYDVKEDGTKSAQLHFRIDENKFSVTKPSDLVSPKEQSFLLYSYLEALKYLPQEAIRAMTKDIPQRYTIALSPNDGKYNEGRQIYYDKNGVTEKGSWLIRLDIQPMYGSDDRDFHGVGNDIVHVYYRGDGSHDGLYDKLESSFKPLTTDQAVIKALSTTSDYHLGGECFGEGHIILGTEQDGDATKIYTLTMVGYYGFVNNNFEKVSGSGIIPAVITLNNNVTIEYPKDGSHYATSIKEMFPLQYHSRILGDNESDRKDLTKQEQAYAKKYLSKLSRTAEIGDYGDFEHILLTHLGVSVEVSNRLENFYKLHSYYPYFIGTKEIIEDGVRMVYEMSYHENQKEI